MHVARGAVRGTVERRGSPGCILSRTSWPTGLLQNSRNLAQRSGAGQLRQHALNIRLFRRPAEMLQGSQNFDPFDGIDAEVRLDAGIQIQHLRWIPGALRGYAPQVIEEITIMMSMAIAIGRTAVKRCGRSRYSLSRRNGSPSFFENRGNLAQRACDG